MKTYPNSFFDKFCGIPIIEIFIFIFSYKAFNYVAQNNWIKIYSQSIIITTFVIYEILYHSTALFTFYLDSTKDQKFKAKYKLQEKRKEPSFFEMLVLVSRNQILQIFLFLYLFKIFGTNLVKNKKLKKY